MGLSRTPPRDRVNSVGAPHNKRKNLDSSAEKDKTGSNKERKLSRSASLKDLSVVKLPSKHDEGKVNKVKPTSLNGQKDEGKDNKQQHFKTPNVPGSTPRTEATNPRRNIIAKSTEHREKHCAKCDVQFDDDNCLCCSCCQQWFHSECLDLTAAEIEAFTLLAEKAHYYCDACEIGAKELYLQAIAMKKRIDATDKNVEKLQVDQAIMKSDIYNLQTTQDKNCDDIDSLYTDVGELQTDLKSTATDTNKLKADLCTTSTIVTNLRSQVNKQDESITELELLKADVKNNEEAIKNLKTSLLSTLRDELKSDVQKQIKDQNIVSFPALPDPESVMETDQNASNANKNQQIFRDMINNQCAEREEIMRRKYQLIITNLKEVNSAQEDMNQTTELLKLLKLDEEIQINELIRMGKSQKDKPRLIRITLKDLSTKRKILAKATTLRDIPEDSKFAKVYIKPNLTPQQLQESKNLQEELRARRLQDPNLRLKIQRGKIVTVTPTVQS